MNRTISLLLFASASLLGGCGNEKSLLPFKTQSLHLNLSSDPSSLDPRVTQSLKDLTLVKHLFEGLVSLNKEGQPELALAKDLVISEDGLKYTFFLRDSIWSNGEPVTAFDFEYAWKRVLDPEFGTNYSHMLYPIKNGKQARLGQCSLEEVGVRATNPMTLEVELTSITPYFLELLAFPTFFPINAAFDTSHPKWGNHSGLADATTFVCNGPFQLAKWSPNDSVVLKKNPYYWDAQAVVLDQIDFSIISDNSTECHLFEKGKIDWLGQPISNNIATEVIGEFKKKNQLLSYPIAGTFWVNFNTEKAPFNNAKLRKAFSFAINRQDIITHVLQGNQTVATTPIPPSMSLTSTPFFHDGDIPYANTLFEEALVEMGMTRKDFPAIGLSYPFTERTHKIVQLVQRQWEEAFCVPVVLQRTEGQHYRQLLKNGEFQAATGDWVGDFNDPITFLELFKYRMDRENGGGMNTTGWENPAFTELLDLSTHLTDLESRKALLQEAEKILVDEMPIAPLYHYSFDYIKHQYVQDVVLSPLGLADFKRARIGN